MIRQCFTYALCALLLLLLSACRTTSTVQEVPVIVERTTTDTVRVHTERLDSVYLHDSIYVLQRNDTIYINNFKTQFRYKYIYRDSIQLHTDTVEVPVTITKTETKVQKYTPTYMKWLAGIGSIFLIVLFAWAGIRLYCAFRP